MEMTDTQLPPPLPPRVRSAPSAGLARGARFALAGLSAVCFVVACSQPAIRLENGTIWDGSYVLLFGWFGLVYFQFAWLANVIYPASLLCLALGWRLAASLVAAVQVFVACDMLSFPGAVIYLDEAGVNKSAVAGFSMGAWVWLAALALPLLAILLPRPTKD